VANILIVADASAARRADFVQRVQPMLPPMEGLRSAQCSAGAVHALWAAAPDAPISTASDQAGFAVVWGNPTDDAGTFAGAQHVRAAWADGAGRAWDGFYCAMAADTDTHTVRIAADVLGLFPVYYYATTDVLLAGSSPELFRRHDAFVACLDEVGLAGILLTGAAFDGATLWAGVRRLTPGHIIAWRHGSGARTLRQYELPLAEPRDIPYNAQLEQVDHVIESALQRQLRGTRACAQLLSGGRDSRVLAGVLARGGVQVNALTLGRPGDHEVTCATAVARALGFAHTVVDTDAAAFPQYAALHAMWEHGIGHCAGLYTWGTHTHLRQLGRTVVTGHLLELAIGGAHYARASDRDGRPSDAAFHAWLQRRALSPATVAALLSDHASQLVADTAAAVHARFAAYPGDPVQRALRFVLEHSGRCHAGATPWRLSFGAWPIVPVLDRELLSIVASLPVMSLRDRGLQDSLLRTRFPRLAALPLDRNAVDTTPLSPGVGWRMRNRVARWRATRNTSEQRFYYRVYDLNHDGWVRVREQADACRATSEAIFDGPALQALVPPADARIDTGDVIIDSFGLKTVLGLMIWAGQYARVLSSGAAHFER
jgi:asparagine synthase (glutamine-hydrolysing)